MKKPMVKAMAGALALTMVVTMPMTASAFSFADVFNVVKSAVTDTKTNTNTKNLPEETEPETKPEETEPETKPEETEQNKTTTLPDGNQVGVIEHPGQTGTTTITTTNTNGLDSFKGGQENDKYIIGLTVDKEVVEVEVGGKTETVTATVVMSDGSQVTGDELKDLLVFRKLSTDAAGQDITAGSVAYSYDWAAGGFNAVKRDTLEIRANHGGSFYIEAALKTDKSGEYKYTQRILVNVKEYATDLALADLEGYAKHTYSLDAGLTRTPETSNDKITYTAFEEKTTSKGVVENATKYVKVNANNSLTINKDIPADKKVFVKAVSEKGVVAEARITTKEATPITKLTAENKKVALDFNDFDNGVADYADLHVVASVGKGRDTKVVDGSAVTTTDEVTWTSKNPAIACVTEVGNDKFVGSWATVNAVKPGKTTVTAKATSGKSVTFSITVTADLQKIIAIVDENGDSANAFDVYPGQKVELEAEIDPAEANTKITWKSDNKNVTVNKGLVTVKPKNEAYTAKIYAEFTRKYYDASSKKFKTEKVSTKDSAYYTLTVTKSDLKAEKIVLDDTYKIGKEVYKNDSITSDVIYVTKFDDYNAAGQKKVDGKYVSSEDNAEILNNMLTWTSSKAANVSVDATGFATAKNAGKVTLTASVVNEAGKTLKAKVSVASTQVVRALETNKKVVNVTFSGNSVKPVTLKVTKQLPKNATKESLRWEIVESTCDSASIAYASNKTKFDAKKYVAGTASAKLSFGEGVAYGDSITVKVTAANGASQLIVVNVVRPTTKVEFRTDVEKATTKISKTQELKVGATYDYNLYDLATIISGKGANAKAVKAGTPEYEDVTFSVNKSGIVTIGQDGTVYGVKAGTVKITAKTPSGKSATLTIKVVNPTRGK